MQYRFIKTGVFAGQTKNFGGYQFVDGVFTLGPDAQGVSPSAQDASALNDYLGKCYEAFLEGSPELLAAQAGEPVKPGPAKADRDAPDPNKARIALVRDALTKLSVENDDHWTGAGLPSVEAIRTIAGSKELSRGDIDEAAPGMNREETRKNLAGGAGDPLDS
jgi:hypothetical protein